MVREGSAAVAAARTSVRIRRACLGAGALGLLALLSAIPPSADGAAAKNLDLRASGVRSATVAHAGGPLPVTLKVSTTGRTKQTSARILLSKDARRSADDIVLPGSGRVRAARRRGQVNVTVDAQVPAGTAPGSFTVLACADDPGRIRERNERNNCSAARAKVTITATADEARSSAALIAADLASGKLTREKALTYRVFALFSDSRLPARYLGDAGGGADHLALREVADAWRTLSKSARRALARYMLSPAAKGSWYQRSRGTAGAAQYQETAEECVSERFRLEWNTRSAAGGRVKLHWPKDRPQASAMAADLAQAAHVAYGHHKRVMGREPLSDAKSCLLRTAPTARSTSTSWRAFPAPRATRSPSTRRPAPRRSATGWRRSSSWTRATRTRTSAGASHSRTSSSTRSRTRSPTRRL